MPSLDEFLRAGQRRPWEAIALDEPVPLEALHTPALVLDLQQFERNLAFMQGQLDAAGLGLRAHAKMHKCPIIAKRQLELGALGICAAKVSEAEVLAAAGVENILISSPIVTAEKAERLLALVANAKNHSPAEGRSRVGASAYNHSPLEGEFANRKAIGGGGNGDLASKPSTRTGSQVKIVVDSESGAKLLQERCQAQGLSMGVFIDLDPDMGRTGIATGAPALALARFILDSCPALEFAGLQMYAGHCMHIEGFAKRQDKYRRVMQKGLDTREAFAQAGIAVPAFSGGGTGTYNMEAELGLLTDLQAGSYAFMDIEYRDIGGKDGAGRFEDFPVALFVLATAISQPQTRLITVDAGFKTLATDKMPPEFRDLEGVQFHWGGDEHGIVALDNPSRQPAVGEKLELLTPHCDPTVNLHDYLFPYRDGVVNEVWPIAARGCSQ